VRELLIRSTELIPIVIVMEDLHWADMTSLELLESVFRLAQTYRVVFINVFRPGYWQGDDRKIEALSEWLPEVDFAEIAIKPLDRQTGEALVNNMLKVKGLQYAVKQKIVVRSGGNPFFIEEIVRSLIDEGAIVRTNGAFEVTEKIDHVVIPSTINDVLMARIDRLEEQTRDLIKVASVIGRSFFDRILKEVAASIEGVDESLGHLKETQFIRDRMRMGELEHLFKHALAQEVVYESILYQKRIYLHLQVAASIEHLFQDKLYEFYGVLAYHYGKGENLGKAEEYLIKAGEESLKSSASNEALNCFQEALNLYLTKCEDNADPEKIAMFEKNIGLAYYYKGLFVNALEHFDSVLDRFGQGSPKSSFYKMFRLVFDMLTLVVKLYLFSMRSKRKPTKTENMIFDIFQKRGICLLYFDTTRFFIENISFIKKLTCFDIKQIDTGVYSFCSSSGIFALTGIFFGLSGRIIKQSKTLIDKNDIKELFCYEFYRYFYQLMSGKWSDCRKFNANLLDLNLKKGRAWMSAAYILHNGLLKIEQGLFKEAQMLANKFDEVWEVYEYQNAKGNKYDITIKLLLKRRKIQDAINEVEKGIDFQKESGGELRVIHFLGLKAIIQISQKDLTGAEISLNQVKEIISNMGRVSTYYITSYIMGRLLFDLNVLEQAIIINDFSNISKLKKRTFNSAKKALKTANKCALDKVEALKLMGTFFWVTNKQKKALKYWAQSISDSKKMGSSLELSRTYFEVGKRLLEDGSEQKELKGIGAEEYLNKARNIFEDLDLQWDLEQLERFSSNI